MIYGSVCSGIEAATVAWEPLGWRPAFFAEIEKFPRAVLQHHHPDVPLHGDFTTIGEGDYEPIDLLVAGTPCQDFSVAGKRLGLDAPRGNLALEFLALARRLRPRWLVFENVPGLLSNWSGGPAGEIEPGRERDFDENSDFAAFLGALRESGYLGCWRSLDAQYFGVPQRRRRVFVVGYSGDWRPAAAILFERESLQGHPAPRREAGERPAPSLAARTRGGGGLGTDAECDGAVIPIQEVGGRQSKNQNGIGLGIGLDADVMYTLQSGQQHGVATAFQSKASSSNSMNPSEIAPSLDVGKSDGLAVAFHQNQRPEVTVNNTVGALNSDGGKPSQGYPAVAVALRGRDGGVTAELSDTPSALRASQGGGDKAHVLTSMAVRRLIPRECERLQGFEDDYTAIPWRGKPAEQCPDGPRYKVLGNSMAVPCMAWIGERIQAFEDATTGTRAA